MTSIRIVYRPSTRIAEEGGNLSLRVLHQRQYKLVSTGLSLLAKEWDEDSQRPVTYTENPERQEALSLISSKLDLQIQQLQTIINKLAKKGRYTVDNILSQYKLRAEKNSFYQFVEMLSRDLEQQKQERTARAYLSVRKRFIKFNDGKDIPLHHLNTLVVHQFEKQLKEEGLKPNTTSFYMRNLRAIYNKAIAQGQLTAKVVSPFAGVFTGLAPTVKRALSVEELAQIKNLDLSFIFEKKSPEKEALTQAKDLFLFAFYARGMSFVDMAYLKKENIKDGLITYCRKKTGQQLEITLTAPLIEILNRYKERQEGSEYVFPIINNSLMSPTKQYMRGLSEQNKLLKDLAKYAGVQKHLSTHMARHNKYRFRLTASLL